MEKRLATFDWLDSVGSYATMLERLFGFYSVVEPRLLAGAGQAPGLDLERRVKTPLLIADLRALGRSESELGRLPRSPAVPRLDGVPRVMGALYVLEGATLGGKVIEREVGRRLGLDRASGTAFFGAYGSDAARNWRRMCAIIERAALAGGVDAMLATAELMFASLDTWLAG